MKVPRAPHRWSVSPRQAVGIQRALAECVRVERLAGPVRVVVGADMAFTPDGGTCIAGVVAWDVERRAVIETALARRAARFPYVPGLLSFREAPAVLTALRKLSVEPDVLMLDGQGLAHPRRFGLACHVGLCADRPSVGCAKSRLCGEYVEPGPRRGEISDLMHDEQCVGAVLRSRDGVRPLFVSVGHRITLADAVRVVLDCGAGLRVPEPTRLAHHLVTRAAHGD